MNRLTERMPNGSGVCSSGVKCGSEFDCHDNQCFQEVLNRLAHYEDLEEQGLLIKLPCKVGDIFYINIQKKTYECKISGFYINKDEIQFMVAFRDEDNKTWYEIGETHKKEDLFLTREEAEKALLNQKS